MRRAGGLATLHGHRRDVGALAVSSDGERFATGARAATIRVHEAASERLSTLLLGHEGSVTVLAFHAGDRRLVSAGYDQLVIDWDVVRGTSAGTIWSGTGARLMAPVWYDQDADSVWLSTSGRLIEVSLDPQDWIARACEVVGRDLTPTEWDRFVPGDAELRSICN